MRNRGMRDVLVVLATLGLIACGSFSGTDTPGGAPGPSDPNGDDRGISGEPTVPAPAGCDPNAEPSASPACVVDEYALFVDPNGGSDTAVGTKALPMKTITAALARTNGKPRIYVCVGTFTEHVKLTTGTSLYGGFACGDWSYTGTRVRVVPGDVGPALTITSVAGDVSIVDLDFMAAPGTEAATSSIAAVVVKSPKVTMRRVSLTAQDGYKGADGAAGAPGTLVSATPNAGSFDASNATSFAAQTCTCSTGDVTAGGKGGSMGGVSTGKDGMPAQPVVSPDGHDGKGGVSYAPGVDGSDAQTAAPGLGAVRALDLDEDLLTLLPRSGDTGAKGSPGQGGGGGGLAPGGGGVPTEPGRSGGCGGCGGHPGTGGAGGGASVALLAVDASVEVTDSALKSAAAGGGGTGMSGGAGASGGEGGPPGTYSAKKGGHGGIGASGSGGGGGAGGVSAGIVHRGTPPALDRTAITTGLAGQRGIGSSPGTNDGVEGAKIDVFALP